MEIIVSLMEASFASHMAVSTCAFCLETNVNILGFYKQFDLYVAFQCYNYASGYETCDFSRNLNNFACKECDIEFN